MSNHKHFILYKPFGYLSQFINNQTRRRNKKLLGELGDFPERIMAIGRLDQTSEGLLLLTTDGKVSHEITSSNYEKEYYVQVDGIITLEALELLRNSVTIRTHKKYYDTKPCTVILLEIEPIFEGGSTKIRDERHGPTSWISITLTEGKFRQIRKMTAKVGFPTLRLVRIRVGNHTLTGMKVGESKEIVL